MRVSVVIPTHNPHADRFTRALAGLRAQTLPRAAWELIVVDNRSDVPITVAALDPVENPNASLVREEMLGLTWARIRGFREARGEAIVLVDDDNVLAPDFLEKAVRLLVANPGLGAVGGRSLPEWEEPPAPWVAAFPSLLALRDMGAESITAEPPPSQFPDCAPLGAGFVVRREPALAWVSQVEADPLRQALDRTGQSLISGGDNDLALTVMEQGWGVGYFPSLSLTHLIPASRMKLTYLACLQRATARSFLRVLALHRLSPWPALAPWTLPLRKLRAWLRLRPWADPASRLRWEYAVGHFEGRADEWRSRRA